MIEINRPRKPKFKAGDIIIQKDAEEWNDIDNKTITIVKVGKNKYLYYYNNDKTGLMDNYFDVIETVYRKLK